ncbi:glutamate dehydrogenase [Lebetimonas natsushimae]|uniref:Glutamate dehydrogenase n=1 Tax=Lebetimonas natsushimae TaxID=1936991 RepID=A0A292YHA5_9BACT|nr:NAD-glutamate dehydrogenase domain-containing protein [Lebetimonas natsushimae]GAX88124.1 glutamate dehydrogenase [Lebetimonas natsushimae]
MIKFNKNTYELKINKNFNASVTTLSKLLDNFNIQILDINKNKKSLILKLDINNIEKFEKNKKIFFQIINKAINNEITYNCKLYFFAWLGFDLRKISLLRAFVKYQKQILFEFNENDIIKTFIKHNDIVNLIINYFLEKFSKKADYSKNESEIEQKINKIQLLNEFKIINFFYLIIKYTLRTNYFFNKESISFKIDTSKLKPFLFSIQPNIESFVYHEKFNGIHLRMSKISRGGIRYSTRIDFREEIKDLMTAQIAKNAIIVPGGAKGGFYIFSIPTKEEFKKIYSLFIDALLDLVDTPDTKNLIKYDEKDKYFVVAADRGTANMSDIANKLAIKRGFNLKDAFASGGENGYSHKKLGITAKGALTAANRHFIELNNNIFTDKISVIGVGSMRGDVFGNGMLLNKKFLLLAAISHNEIFIDPNPNPEIAYKERKRLFAEEKGWSDYNKNLISKGGGVFKRDEKKIIISPEIKKVFNIESDYLSGEELIKYLLKTPVDMLYFGGIGTYVKSSEENNLYISDKQNENIRVNASEIKAKVICEGANLSLTQKARYEYALNGGKIHLDSIDNSAGVNISDYEVNLKITLNTLIDKNLLTEKEKNDILKNLTNEVIEKVLKNNYLQPLRISLDERKVYKEKLINIIEILEKNLEIFKRENFSIPKNSEIEILFYKNKPIKPLLALLLLYSKIFLKEYILKNLKKCKYSSLFLKNYFPIKFYNSYSEEINNHLLKNEIIATQITNDILNNHGISFISNYNEKEFNYKITAYIILNDLINADKIRNEIYSLDNKINYEKQYEILLELEEVIKFASNWLKKELENNLNPVMFITYKEKLQNIFSKKYKNFKNKKNIEIFLEWKEIFKFIPAIIYFEHKYEFKLENIVKLFENTLKKFKINKLLHSIKEIKPKNRIEKNLKEEVESMIEYFVITFNEEILKNGFDEHNINNSINKFLKIKKEEYEKIIKEINSLCKEKNKSLLEISHISNSLILNLLK